MVLDAIHRIVVDKASLTREEARAVMAQILSGDATDAQIAALLAALHMKGETVEEIVGFAEAIRAVAIPVPFCEGSAVGVQQPEHKVLVDTCGTGGDARGTFNISTATALVVAGAGVRVAKHGNRSITSKCGSADVMEALGVKITLPPAVLADCLHAVGIAFMFAPSLHTAMKYVQAARRDVKLRSVFNLLGPLTNPARATAQVIGVYSEKVVENVARALIMLGIKRGFVVHGADGLDEITITGPTKIAEVRADWLRVYEIAPEQFGLSRASLESISGWNATENARIIRAILAGERSPRRDVVLLNSAAVLVAAGKADSISDAISLAEESLDSSAACAKLDALIAFTNAQIDLASIYTDRQQTSLEVMR